ncbi:MAG: hypothetical protein ABFD29_01405 [Anaerolineaceae bacterium]
MTALISPEITLPFELQGDDFRLEPLTPAHVELDYDAVMSSPTMLHHWSQSDWPAPNFTLHDNLKDLEWHHAEHLNHESFTYTVLTPDRQKCLGCVYINPPNRTLTEVNATPQEIASLIGVTAIVDYWIRSDVRKQDFEFNFVTRLVHWLENDWPLELIAYLTNQEMPTQIELFNRIGFRPIPPLIHKLSGVAYLLFLNYQKIFPIRLDQ